MKSVSLTQRLCWVLHQLIRFLIATPLMVLAFAAFIGGAVSLFLSSKIVNLSYRFILPKPPVVQAPYVEIQT